MHLQLLNICQKQGFKSLATLETFTNLTGKRLLRKTVLRSSYRRCSLKKGILKNFAKFTGKHLCRSFFYQRDSDTGVFSWILRSFQEHLFYITAPSNYVCLLKRELHALMLSYEFCKISQNSIFIEHFVEIVSVFANHKRIFDWNRWSNQKHIPEGSEETWVFTIHFYLLSSNKSTVDEIDLLIKIQYTC